MMIKIGDIIKMWRIYMNKKIIQKDDTGDKNSNSNSTDKSCCFSK